jgi:hypothetical protein
MGRLLQGASRKRVDGVSNVLTVFGLADGIDIQEGMAAYERYHKTMRRIAYDWGYDMEQIVGAFCALSPNNDWIGNLRSLVTVLKAHRLGISPDRVVTSTYNACKSRAWKCLGAEHFLDFTRGPKTRNFYTNIYCPEENHSVTIDGHMYGVWLGKRMTMKAVAEQRFNYNEVAHDFRTAAFHIGIRPNQVQAVCWFTWKRIHKVLFKEQLGLFASGDQWGLLQDPELIEPFPFKGDSQ